MRVEKSLIDQINSLDEEILIKVLLVPIHHEPPLSDFVCVQHSYERLDLVMACSKRMFKTGLYSHIVLLTEHSSHYDVRFWADFDKYGLRDDPYTYVLKREDYCP